MSSVEVVPRRYQGTRCVRSLSAVLLVAALGVLAGCQREAPTELGPATAAAEPTPPPPPPAAPSRITPEMVAAADAIDGDDVRAVVAEIADDRYMGRSPGSAGDKMTRAYLEKELAKRGFAPGGEGGSWEQPVELVGVTAAAPAKWTFERGAEHVALDRDTDFVASSGVQAARASVDGAEVVFVGYGIEAPEYDWDDFKGMDVSGKVLLMLNNDPDWDPALFAGTERLFYGRWVYKYEERGPSRGGRGDHHPHDAVRGLSMAHGAGELGRRAVQAARRRRAARADRGVDHRGRGAAHARARRQNLDALVEQAKRRDFKPVPLGIKTSIALRNTITRTQSANVLGVLRGSDPELADELVIFSAHHDHLGVGAPDASGKPGDRIYNGARDNAAGVGTVLAIGKAIAALPEHPRRSVLLNVPGGGGAGLARLGIFRQASDGAAAGRSRPT